jgi:hypothetical protein
MKEFHWSTLHFITRLIVVAAVLRLSADTIVGLRDLGRVRLGAVTWAEWIASVAHAFGYSLLFFASAATVELLYRIWREFREMRAEGVTFTDRQASQAPGEPSSPA